MRVPRAVTTVTKKLVDIIITSLWLHSSQFVVTPPSHQGSNIALLSASIFHWETLVMILSVLVHSPAYKDNVWLSGEDFHLHIEGYTRDKGGQMIEIGCGR